MNAINSIFSSYEAYLKQEQTIKDNIQDEVKNLEKFVWSLHAKFEAIHGKVHEKAMESLCNDLQAEVAGAKEFFSQLQRLIPNGQYYKYNYLLKTQTQKLIEIVALLHYLLDNRLISYEETAKTLGLKVMLLQTENIPAENQQLSKETRGEPDQNQCYNNSPVGSAVTAEGNCLYLDLEDYLIGCLMMSSVLARLSVNSVSASNDSLPIRINQFLRELHSAFTLLHFKNSYLRKSYDELKYSLKKSEEVVYNLSLRGLTPPTACHVSSSAVLSLQSNQLNLDRL